MKTRRRTLLYSGLALTLLVGVLVLGRPTPNSMAPAAAVGTSGLVAAPVGLPTGPAADSSGGLASGKVGRRPQAGSGPATDTSVLEMESETATEPAARSTLHPDAARAASTTSRH